VKKEFQENSGVKFRIYRKDILLEGLTKAQGHFAPPSSLCGASG
jgi:hypothetical protein